ncbi:glycosyltransferase [Geodermatophilus sp. Leaf369]|uniref:glycosyltransferase n=1 Tax=Geodermatophilus sp. Leaf369 TaxID=1736354 RepID=UPI0012F96319|nr:glycosyltransferase [Geodermatophilus sp. Leaf369]
MDQVHASRDDADLWLLLTALTGAYPLPDLFLAARRERELQRAPDFAAWLLEAGYLAAREWGSPEAEMDVVSSVVVDVDFSAGNDLHTGIQRVVRETIPRWAGEHELVLAGWTATGGALRTLQPREEGRVLRWHQEHDVAQDTPRRGMPDPPASRLLVPWHTTVVLLENPRPESCGAIVGLARFSGSEIVLIGYDCIPAISPELIHHGLPDRFMRYLEVVKHATRVACISRSVAAEFRGFIAMLGAQGLRGPEVLECVLPVAAPVGGGRATTDVPVVVCIGSFEPRKNQLAVLHAAEHLWRQGLEFELQFIGGGGWATEFDTTMHRLQADGRRIRRLTAVSDRDLWSALRSARFSVFVSLHEGFGLPVAESLAVGTPCLTTDYGSTREIAEGGGALVVDPLDDLAIAAQMHRLLTDDVLVAGLRADALGRTPRDWSDYARDLWAISTVTVSDGGAP